MWVAKGFEDNLPDSYDHSLHESTWVLPAPTYTTFVISAREIVHQILICKVREFT